MPRRSSFNGCAVSPDGKFIVSASADHTLKVWDAGTGKERWTLQGHSDEVRRCAVSSEGNFIVSASNERLIMLWTGTGQRLAALRVDGRLASCTWSPDGEHLVAAGERGVYFLRLVQ